MNGSKGLENRDHDRALEIEARAALDRSLHRLASRSRKLIVPLLGVAMMAEVMAQLRLGSALGASSVLPDVVLNGVALIVAWYGIEPAIRFVYRSLVSRGELRKVALRSSKRRISGGFAGSGTPNIVTRNALEAFERLVGWAIPTFGVGWRDGDRGVTGAGFLYEDEVPLTPPEEPECGYVLVDPKWPARSWLVRQRG